MAGWNPWHGCHKHSAGCLYCYVFRSDAKIGRDSTVVEKNSNFDLPVRKKRDGSPKIPSGEVVYTCFSSDFLVEDADEWRIEAWSMIRERYDLNFMFITKRIERFFVSLPEDWGEGYENVSVCCTVENQDRADFRLPIFLSAPIKHKMIVCEPLLSHLDLSPYLTDDIEMVSAGGESGDNARICDYDWILDLRSQCIMRNIPFRFRQTGANLLKDGRLYKIPRKFQHNQAKKAGLDYKC